MALVLCDGAGVTLCAHHTPIQVNELAKIYTALVVPFVCFVTKILQRGARKFILQLADCAEHFQFIINGTVQIFRVRLSLL